MWIIPARAGFTDLRVRGIRALRGSSPLARGLRIETPRRNPVNRIIPARAGFTASRSHNADSCQDHPRSRGVYLHDRHGHADHRGSSPLARGLHDDEVEPDFEGRIIPARAGFTHPKRSFMRGEADHPRSRGVYQYASVLHVLLGGSSPLARGLQHSTRQSSCNRRIIPARAGFTYEPP